MLNRNSCFQSKQYRLWSVTTFHFVCCVELYGPVNPMGSCWVWSVYLTTLLLGRLSTLKRLTSIVLILSPETDNCPSWISGRERMKIFHDQFPQKNVAYLEGVEPVTSWSPVGHTSNWAIEASYLILWHLIWVYTICQHPFYGMLGLNGSKGSRPRTIPVCPPPPLVGDIIRRLVWTFIIHIWHFEGCYALVKK